MFDVDNKLIEHFPFAIFKYNVLRKIQENGVDTQIHFFPEFGASILHQHFQIVKNENLGFDIFLISRQQSDLKYYFENYFFWCLSSVLQDGGLMHVVLLTSMECIIHYDRTTTSLTGSSGTTGRAQDTLSKLRLWWFDQQISKCFVIMWIMYCIVFKDLFYQATCLIFSSPETCSSVLKCHFSTVPELQSPWSAKAPIIQPDTMSKASTWYNSDLAKWLNKKNIQETVRQIKDSVLLIIYVMYVLVNNWNCEEKPKIDLGICILLHHWTLNINIKHLASSSLVPARSRTIYLSVSCVPYMYIKKYFFLISSLL